MALGLVHLMRAFDLMLAQVTAADASRRQVRSILEWREVTRRVLDAALSPEGTFVGPADSRTHRGWRAAAEGINDALRIQEQFAIAAQTEAAAEADREDQAASDSEAAAAAADAEAQRSDTGADVAGRARAAQQAREHRQAAAQHRQAAEAARKRAADATDWMIAALDARQVGERVIAEEDSVAIPVGDAITGAGGLPEVYGDKNALTRAGAR